MCVCNVCIHIHRQQHVVLFNLQNLLSFFFQAQSVLTVSYKVMRKLILCLICCSLNSQLKEKFNVIEMLSFCMVSCSEGDQKG